MSVCVCVYLHQADDNLYNSINDSTTLLLSAKQNIFNNLVDFFKIWLSLF